MNECFNRDALQMNIAGRVMMSMTRCRIAGVEHLSTYVAAVLEAVLRRLEDDPTQAVDRLIDEQLVFLERSLCERAERAEAARRLAAQEAGQPTEAASSPADAHREVERPRRRHVVGGAETCVRSMEEKLRESREPVQKLVLEDCVTAGLLDQKKARTLVAGMTGKQPEDAELEIVEYLREVLLQQVKAFMRKNKGGPWANPRVQADLRSDIHHVHTVRGVLTLARQIIKERRAWEQENGKGGILGLFAGRR
jgi:hypothetical protein